MNRVVEEVSAAYLVETVGGDVPAGYKKTEVGVVPEDWNVGPFGKLFEKISSRKALRSSELVSFVGMQDVTENARLKSVHLVNFEEVKAGFTYFEKKDVLVAKITPCFEHGKGCFTNNLPTDVGFGSTEFHVLRASDSSDADFIYFWTTTRRLRTALESEMVGSAGHRRVPLHALQNYVIPYPKCKNEQSAIAKILSDLDLLMERLETLILKKQAVKAAAMQQLLTGRTRLPQFALREDGSPKGFKNSELGDIPQDWEVKPLSEVCSLKSGQSITADSISDEGGYPCYGGNGLRGFADNPTHSGRYVLVGRQGALCGNVNYVEGDFFASEHALVATGKNSVDMQWLALVLERMNLNQYSESSAQPGLSAIKLKVLPVLVPPLGEQQAIALLIRKLVFELSSLNNRLTKTRQLKQGMMQQLLTGKIRLLKASTVSAS